jgi:hypothetical protein
MDTGLYEFPVWAGDDGTGMISSVNHVPTPHRIVTGEPTRFIPASSYSCSQPKVFRRPSRRPLRSRERGCEYTKHISAQQNAERFAKSFNCVDTFKSHYANAPDLDLVYVHGLCSQQEWASTKRPSARRIAEKPEKTYSTVEKTLNHVDFFRSHPFNAFGLDRKVISHARGTHYVP